MSIPAFNIDQIIDIKTGFFGVGAGITDGFGNVSSTNGFDERPSWQGALYLFKGIWSHDGGASWREFGNSVVLGTAANDVRTLNVDANMSSTNGIDAGGNGIFDVVATNTGASGYVILYKMLFMARPDQGNIPITPLIKALRYSSKLRYMKILLDDVFTAPLAGTTPIAHNLGYLPNVSAWTLVNFDPAFPNEWQLGSTGGGSTGGGFSADNSNNIDTMGLTFRVKSTATVTRKVYYRVYTDA